MHAYVHMRAAATTHSDDVPPQKLLPLNLVTYVALYYTYIRR